MWKKLLLALAARELLLLKIRLYVRAGLQFLTLRYCGISEKTLARIKFLELSFLDVSGNLEVRGLHAGFPMHFLVASYGVIAGLINLQMTKAGIIRAMRVCPSLGKLIIPGLELSQEEKQGICPRLRQILRTN